MCLNVWNPTHGTRHESLERRVFQITRRVAYKLRTVGQIKARVEFIADKSLLIEKDRHPLSDAHEVIEGQSFRPPFFWSLMNRHRGAEG